jgi:predicted RNA-binding Zn-ribbon protein involved in translation (DUF1610 family)
MKTISLAFKSVVRAVVLALLVLIGDKHDGYFKCPHCGKWHKVRSGKR